MTQLAFDKKSDQRRKYVNGERYPNYHDEDIEYAQRVTMRGIHDLAVSDAGERNHCHVHGVEQRYRRSAKGHVSHDGNGCQREQQTAGEDEAVANVHSSGFRKCFREYAIYNE